jgi:hypothetical protein
MIMGGYSGYAYEKLHDSERDGIGLHGAVHITFMVDIMFHSRAKSKEGGIKYVKQASGKSRPGAPIYHARHDITRHQR